MPPATIKPKKKAGPPTLAAELYRVRAMQILHDRILGLSYLEIQEKYNISHATVTRSLNYAEREGLTKGYENKLIGLAAKALAIYEKQLDEGDPYVAKDVIDKLVKMGDRFSQKETAEQELGLKAYIATTRRANKKAEDTVDGTVIDSHRGPGGATDPNNDGDSVPVEADFQESYPDGAAKQLTSGIYEPVTSGIEAEDGERDAED